MSLLREFIKEELALISEKYVTLSTEDQIMNSAEKLFSMIKSNTALKDEILTKDESGKWLYTQDNRLPFLEDFFKVEFKTKQEHKEIKADVSFFMDNPDEKYPSDGLHKTISEEKSEISLNYEIVSKQPLSQFKKLIYHELIHSQDPLLRNRELKKTYTRNQIDKIPKEFWSNKFSEEEKSKIKTDSYLNSTYEFSAFIGELVFDIKSRAKGDPKKIGLLKDLMFLLMKNASGSEMTEEEIKIAVILKKEGVFTDYYEFYDFAEDFKKKARFWSNNPKHKKKLRKYLGQGIFDASEASRKAKEESNPRPSKQKEKATTGSE